VSDLLRRGSLHGHVPGDTPAQADPTRNPDGLYSGIAKRNAIGDGAFVPKEVYEGAQDTLKPRRASKE
jgi:hypothetical protein